MIAADAAALTDLDGGHQEPTENTMIKLLSTVTLTAVLLLNSVALTQASPWPKILWDRIQTGGR